MTDVLEDAKRLKDEAKTNIVLAKKLNNTVLYEDALENLEEARDLLYGEIKTLPPGDTNKLLQLRLTQVASEIADCFGISGGIYRKMGQLSDAIGMYDKGFSFEENADYKIMNSYNMVNSIVLKIADDHKSLESMKPQIEKAIAVIKKQIDASRDKDWWAWADLGLLYIMMAAEELAVESYRKIKNLGPADSNLGSMTDVLMQLHIQINTVYPDTAKLIEKCVVLLKQKN